MKSRPTPQEILSEVEEAERSLNLGETEYPIQPAQRTGYRMIVTGSRKWAKRDQLWDQMDQWSALRQGPITLVCGFHPRGADFQAIEWYHRQLKLGNPVLLDTRPAAWDKFGQGAGVWRNEKMAQLGADICIAAGLLCDKKLLSCPQGDHYTHGTHDMVKRALDYEIPVRHVGVNVPEVYFNRTREPLF